MDKGGGHRRGSTSAHHSTGAHNFKQLQPMSTMQKSLIPLARAQRSRRLAVCAPASTAIEARESCRAPPGSTPVARWRPSHQIVSVQPGAQQHQLEVAVGLVAARDVANSAAPGRAVPCDARRARPRLCEVHVSVCRCKNVLVSSMCRTMELCVGVCTVGVHALVLARACERVPCKRRRTTPLAPETARPLSSRTTSGPGCDRSPTAMTSHRT